MITRWRVRTMVRLRYLRYTRTPRRLAMLAGGVVVLGLAWIVVSQSSADAA